MTIHFWAIGKKHDPYVKNGVEEFTSRIANYFPVKWQIFPTPKGSLKDEQALKKKESEIIRQQLHINDFFITLDENGNQLSSEQLSQLLQTRANTGQKRLIFLTGGAFGLDKTILQRADVVWSLSKLTFPHQLVRLILAEQIYRACTILRNEKYHHR